MLQVVKSNVGALGDRGAGCNTNAYIGEIFVRVRKWRELQWLVASAFGRVGKADARDLNAIQVEACDGYGTALCKASGRASVRAQTEVEALKVESFYPWTPDELSVCVECELTKLE